MHKVLSSLSRGWLQGATHIEGVVLGKVSGCSSAGKEWHGLLTLALEKGVKQMGLVHIFELFYSLILL